MYSSAPAVQSYNPAASTDGSTHQMHSVPAPNQPYYSLPAQQMSMPPGAPVTSQMASYGAAGQPAVTMGQPQYSMPTQGPVAGGAGYQPHTVPGAPAGYQAPSMHTQQPAPGQMYMPSSTSSAQQPPQPGTGTNEYQPYNMQRECTQYAPSQKGLINVLVYNTVKLQSF